MQQFHTRPERFNELRKAILFRSIPLALLATGGGIAISYGNASMSKEDNNFIFIILPFMLLVVAFGLYRAIGIQQKLFNSYRITFDRDYVTRERFNTPTITIPYSRIVEISKNHNDSFTIKGDSALNVIGIPAQITDYDQLELLLSGIRPITIKTVEPFYQRFSGVLSLVAIGLMVTVYFASNKLLVGVSGTLVLALMTYSFIVIQRNKNLDNKTRRGSWWFLVVIASLLATMYVKLFVTR